MRGGADATSTAAQRGQNRADTTTAAAFREKIGAAVTVRRAPMPYPIAAPMPAPTGTVKDDHCAMHPPQNPPDSFSPYERAATAVPISAAPAPINAPVATGPRPPPPSRR